MNNKDFISGMANRMGISTKEVSALTQHFCQEVGALLENEDSINIQGFGTFEVKKKLERVVINPATKQRMLVPPKLVISFKASSTIKEQLKAIK
ncbi:MAG: HU family DNA-binding protein [Bacteroidaceae bacterium]|nr:HU family DNA-binding protein [Prevotellaceae bacterium]MDY5631758.1 HU family DNA-binding protein [Bacteroidaceae bacterium]